MACTVTATDASARLPAHHHLPHRPGARQRADAHPLSRPGSRTTWPAVRVRPARRARQRQRRRRHRRTAGADTGVVDAGRRRRSICDTNTVSQAANRDYAVPTYMALDVVGDPAAPASATPAPPSDGLTQLDATHALTARTRSAPGRPRRRRPRSVTPSRGDQVDARARLRPHQRRRRRRPRRPRCAGRSLPRRGHTCAAGPATTRGARAARRGIAAAARAYYLSPTC